MEELVTGKSK